MQHSSSSSTRSDSIATSAPSLTHSNCTLCDQADGISNHSRFDWRTRATSRVSSKKPHITRKARDKWPKRILPPHPILWPGDPYHKEHENYKEHFLELLTAEQHEGEAVLRDRLASWSLDRLKQEGYCITGLAAFWLDTTHYGKPVASFALGPGITLPQHQFDNGTQVMVTRFDPLKEEPLRGSVLSCSKTQLRISFGELFDIDDGRWRLDVGRSSIAFDRMRAAIGRLSCDVTSQESSPDADASDREYILQGTHLRDVLLSSFQPSTTGADLEDRIDDDRSTLPHSIPNHRLVRSRSPPKGIFSRDMRIQSWARRYSRMVPLVVEGDPAINGLNITQIRAVAMMLDQRFTLVQGPPGTGKTKTIIEAVKLLKVHFEIPQPILLCTYTNVAVDNLVEGLVAAGLNPLRVGYGGKVQDSLSAHTLEYKMKAHPLAPRFERTGMQADNLEKQRRDLLIRIYELKAKGTQGTKSARLANMETAALTMQRQIKALKGKAYGMYQEMLRDIVHRSDVVCTTCITSASVQLNVSDFPIVFIDEASMSTEPATLIPLMKGSQHVALIGDHKQLPPVITSPEAQAKGLGISLFERLAEEGAVPSIMLNIQYRMHPRISHFPSHEFYNFSVSDGTVDASGLVASHLQPPNTSVLARAPSGIVGQAPSVVFLHHGGGESMKDRSRVNITEAHIVCSVLEDLLLHNPHLRGADIGVIAPYVAQISLLKRFLTIDEKYFDRFQAVLGSHRAMQIPFIEIKTVDGFEGREKDVIIFSTVRNNSSGHIGFLADRRRLNVGLTRAKRGLITIGNLETLKAGRTAKGGLAEGLTTTAKVGRGAEAWQRYTEYLDHEKLVRRLDGEPLRKLLYGNYPGHGLQIGK